MRVMRIVAVAIVAFIAHGCDSGAGESVLPGVRALVFVQRAFDRGDGTHNVTDGSGQTMDYLRYQPGGGVYVLEPPTPDGELRNLTESFADVDINGVDVSFDGTQVVFSMRHGGIDNYDLFIANIDGSDVRPLTMSPADDVLPIFIPGDRIAFVTNEPYTAMGTRADEYNHSRVVSQIATVSVQTGDADRRLCSQNLSHTVAPFLLSDGTIGFSRWEHLETVNDVKLFRMNPDCTNMVAIAGQFGKEPINSLVQASETAPGRFVAIGTSREGTIQAGAVIEIDARSQTSDNPELYIDVQQATFENLTPNVPVTMESSPSGEGRYRNPRALGDGRYVVSWADGDVNERNELADEAPNFGIYLFDPDAEAGDQRTLIFDNPNMWDLYAIPVAPRNEPPVIMPSVGAEPDPTTPAIIGSIDVTETSLDETVSGAQMDGLTLHDALGQAVAVRIIEGFSSEIGAVGQFGLTMAEGAAILGETPVYADGSWRAAVPPYLPYHLQPIDRFGLAIRNQRLWIQAMPGETRNCGGCHESRSETVQPRLGGMTTLAQQAGEDLTTHRSIPERIELPWYGAASRRNVQELFDANCVECHSGGANDQYAGRSYTVNVTTMEGEMLQYQIPYLDLSNRPLEVYYEDEVVNYPASYVTLLYPSAMMGDSVATGDVPPMWVVPSSARESRLIEVINMTAEGTSELAWADRPLHPEDTPEWSGAGRTLSREDRLMLIRMADLGGQYYSRWNVEGGYDWSMATEYP
jgi:hypothetical protein